MNTTFNYEATAAALVENHPVVARFLCAHLIGRSKGLGLTNLRTISDKCKKHIREITVEQARRVLAVMVEFGLGSQVKSKWGPLPEIAWNRQIDLQRLARLLDDCLNSSSAPLTAVKPAQPLQGPLNSSLEDGHKAPALPVDFVQRCQAMGFEVELVLRRRQAA